MSHNMFTYVMRFLFCLLTILPLSLYAAVGDHFYYADWYYEILSETDMTVANLGARSASTPGLVYPTVEHNNKVYTVIELRKESFSSSYTFKNVDFTNYAPSSYKIKKIGDDVFNGTAIDPNTIPPCIEEIGARNFADRNDITSVTLPSQLRILGSSCFQSCANLQSVKGNFHLKKIGDGAFFMCQKLKTVELSYSVEDIGNDAFVSCSALESLIMPSAKTLGTGAFQDCPKLTSISLPSNLVSIGESAFLYCTGLKSIVIPENVISIGKRAFEHCDKAEYILFKPATEPAYVNWKGEAANFTDCFNADIESKMYVPSRKTYEHGIEMISFEDKPLTYTGLSPEISWKNNTPWPITVDTSNLPKTAGEHNVTLTAAFQNPSISLNIPYTFNIVKAPLKVTVNNSERVYGSFDQNYSCSFEGFVNGESESTVKLDLSYVTEANYQSPVGTYPISATLTPANYEPEVISGTITITKAQSTLEIQNLDELSNLKTGEDVIICWISNAPHSELSLGSETTASVELQKMSTLTNGEEAIQYRLIPINPGEGKVGLYASGSHNHEDAYTEFEVKIEDKAGITNVHTDCVSLITRPYEAIIIGKADNAKARLYDINGRLIHNGIDNVIRVAKRGVYILIVNNSRYEVAL